MASKTHKVTLRMRSGHNLFHQYLGLRIPGEATEMEVDDRQLRIIRQDSRIVSGKEMEAELAAADDALVAQAKKKAERIAKKGDPDADPGDESKAPGDKAPGDDDEPDTVDLPVPPKRRKRSK